MKRSITLFLTLTLIILAGCGEVDNTSSNVASVSSELISSTVETSSPEITSDESAVEEAKNEVTTTSSKKVTTTSKVEKVEEKNNTKDTSSKIENIQEQHINNYHEIENTGYEDRGIKPANPETGISWDGKSPIIYTYTDGTTGTEKRDNATYEMLPGVKVTIAPEIKEEEKYDGKCHYCGKISKDGLNGTCIRWLMCDVNCPNCGEHVSAHTCHTCNK